MYIMLFIALFIGIYEVIKGAFNKRTLNNIVDKIENRDKSREEIQELKRVKYGNIDESGFFNEFNLMYKRSGIKEKITFLTSEIYIGISIILSISLYFFSRLIYNYWAVNLLISLLFLVVMYSIVYYLSGYRFEKIDGQISNFINYFDNFASSSTDIITIIEDTSRYMDGVLKNYLVTFVVEAKQGNIKLAFRNLESKIENPKFQELLKNLEISSRHSAKYKTIINEGREIFKGYFKNKQNRKEKIKEGRTEIVILLVISAVIFNMLKSVTPNLIIDLKTTQVGNLFILIFVLLIAITTLTFIKIDRG